MEARLPAVQDSVCGCRESRSLPCPLRQRNRPLHMSRKLRLLYRSARYSMPGMNHCRVRSWLQALRQIVELLTLSRRGFTSNFFHVLPLSDTVSKTFEQVLASRSGIPNFDKEILREQSTTVFLHDDNDYPLKRFLGILVRISHVPHPLHIL